MPSSNSSVRGLTREIRRSGVEVRQDESCEHMMRRVDRAEVRAVCRHLVGDLFSGRAGRVGLVGQVVR